VERLMLGNGLQTRRKRRFRKTTDSKHSDPIAPNVVARNFDVTAPNHAWVTDITAIWTLEGWLYLVVMLDPYSRRVVAWAANANNDTLLALDTLRSGLRARRPAAGLVHQSDRGGPYGQRRLPRRPRAPGRTAPGCFPPFTLNRSEAPAFRRSC
jgi:transposase InsO family protein